MAKEQVPIYTEHVIHAGMYLRTITLPPDIKLTAVFVKIPTVLIIVGACEVLIGNELTEIKGYAVLPASGGRQQEFTTDACPVILTMAFATQARTIQEAEAQFTDETDILLSHRQDLNKIVITEEQP